MNILIFKTNIRSQQKLNRIKQVINKHSVIWDWSVDIEDIDHVLRIEASEKLKEKDVIDMIRTCGFNCEVLNC